MWSRDSPFALLALGGERHIEDHRFWVEHPNINDSSTTISVGSISWFYIKKILEIYDLDYHVLNQYHQFQL